MIVVVATGPRAVDVAQSCYGRSAAWLRWLEYEGRVEPAPKDSLGRRYYPDWYLQKVDAVVFRLRGQRSSA